jgi:hypothetical protein
MEKAGCSLLWQRRLAALKPRLSGETPLLQHTPPVC